MMEKAVEIQSLYKNYKDVEALKNITFSVNSGELFGLIGPDGAGKTSLFRILTTLLTFDSGSATVYGNDVVKDYKTIRHIVGYMPGTFSLYQDLSVEENLNFFATLFGTTIQANYHLIEPIYVQIEPFKKRKARALSGGMKQKLALCCALIHKPKILFLDEPTTGVDAVSRKEFWDMLKDLKKEGITIVVSTPYMDEASICERIALIQHGEILSINTPTDIIKDFGEPLYAVQSDHMISSLRKLEHSNEIKSVFAFGDTHHVTLTNPSDKSETIQTILHSIDATLEVKPIEPTIEDCFMKLMRET